MALAATLTEDITGAWLNLGGGGGWTLATGEVTGMDATDIVLAFLSGRFLLGSLVLLVFVPVCAGLGWLGTS